MAVGIFKDGQVSNVAAGNTAFTVTNLPHGGWPFLVYVRLFSHVPHILWILLSLYAILDALG